MKRVTKRHALLRKRLDSQGYKQPLAEGSLLLVQRLLDDLIRSREGFTNIQTLNSRLKQSAGEANCSIEPLRQLIAKLQKENNRLHSQIVVVKEKLGSSEAVHSAEYQKLEDQKRHLQFLLDQTHQSNNSGDQFQQKIDVMISRLDNLVVKEENSQKEAGSLSNDTQLKCKILFDIFNLVVRLYDQITQLKDTIKIHSLELKQSQGHLNAKFNKTIQENIENRQQSLTLKNQLLSSEGTINELKYTIQKLQSQVDEQTFDVSAYMGRVNIEGGKRKIETLEHQNDYLNKQKLKLQGKMKNYQKDNRTKISLRKDVAEIEVENQKLRQKLEEYEKMFQDNLDSVRQLEMQRLKDLKFCEEQKVNRDLNEEDLLNKIEELEAQVDWLTNENDKLKKLNKYHLTLLETEKGQSQQVYQKQKTALEQNKVIEERAMDLEREVESKEEELSAHLSDILEVDKKLRQTRFDLDKAQKAIISLRDDKLDLCTQVSNIQDQNDQLKRDNKALLKVFKQKDSDLNSLSEKMQSVTTQLFNERQNVVREKKTVEQVTSLNSKMTNSMSASKQGRTQLTTDIQRLEKSVVEYKRDIQILNQRQEQSNKQELLRMRQVEKQDQEIIDLKRQVQCRNSDSIKITDLNNLNECIFKDLSAYKKISRTTKEQLIATQQKLKVSERNNILKQGDLCGLKLIIKDLNLDIKRLESSVSSREEEYRTSQTLLIQLRQKYDDLSIKHSLNSQPKDQIFMLNREIKDLKRQLFEVLLQLERTKSENCSYQTLIKTLNLKIRNLDKSISNLTTYNEELLDKFDTLNISLLDTRVVRKLGPAKQITVFTKQLLQSHRVKENSKELELLMKSYEDQIQALLDKHDEEKHALVENSTHQRQITYSSVTDLQSQLECSNDNMTSLASEKSNLVKQLNKEKGKVNQLTTKLSTTTKELEDVQEKLKAIPEEQQEQIVTSRSENYSEIVDSLRKEIQMLKTTKSLLTNEVDQQDNKNESLISDIRILKVTIDQLKNNIKQGKKTRLDFDHFLITREWKDKRASIWKQVAQDPIRQGYK